MGKVTKEMLDESLQSIKEYFNNASDEGIYKGMMDVACFEGTPAAEVIGYLEEISSLDQEQGLYDIPNQP